MKKITIFLLILPFLVQGQNKYFVYFKDKKGTKGKIEKPEEFLSARSIERRIAQKISITEVDLPVSDNYLNQILNAGYNVLGKSKWLNAVLVEGKDIEGLQKFSFVKAIEGNQDIRGDLTLGKYSRKKSKFTSPVTPIDYGSSKAQINMIGADTMHSAGFDGRGVLIGVLDAGFPNVNTAEAFSRNREGNHIKRTYNFVYNQSEVYRDHTHGTNVLSIIGGYLPGKLVGTAPGADFALYVTEDAIDANESRLEEVYWAFAAEDADSLGVDIIHSSLGYSEFSDPSQDYTYDQMDGKTTIIVRAANQAFKSGIVVVISAGNEGANSWHYISSPADGEQVITVGAVNVNKQKAGFSSFGPSSDNRIKPDVSAMGVSTVYSNSLSNINAGNGTSYSAPLIAGFMAGLKQQFPTLSAIQLREILIKSADRYNHPDNSYGYGIPSYSRAVQVAKKEYVILGNDINSPEVVIFPNPVIDAETLQIQVNGNILSNNHRVYLLDVLGKTLEEDVPLSQIAFDQLSSGVYFLKFKEGEQWFTKKLLIKI